jgi:anti-anti-sigma regulatory factor
MFPPVIFLLWIIYQDWKQPIAQIEQIEQDAEGYALSLPPQIAVYHLRPDERTKHRTASPSTHASLTQGPVARHANAARTPDHRLPNLLNWLDELSPLVQCVVLDLTLMHRIDPNAALNLAAALDRLRKQHRSLILAGLSPVTFQDLVNSGATDLADPAIVCPDLELAIARAYLLVSP